MNGNDVVPKYDAIAERYSAHDYANAERYYARRARLVASGLEAWRAVTSIILDGAFNCVQACLPHLKKSGAGVIINIGGLSAHTGAARRPHVVAAKAGLIGLTKSLAQEVGSRNITVNAVAPGFIETDMTHGLNPELKQKMLDQTPLKRIGVPEDIASAVKFLVSEEASFITGHVLDVNGGIYM